MKDIIGKLHGKPAETRKRIALGISSLVTICIAIVWVSVTDFSLSKDSSVLAEEKSDYTSQVASPLASMREDIRTLKNNIRELVHISSPVVENTDEELEVVSEPSIPMTQSDIDFTFDESFDNGEIEVIEVFSTTSYPY